MKCVYILHEWDCRDQSEAIVEIFDSIKSFRKYIKNTGKIDAPMWLAATFKIDDNWDEIELWDKGHCNYWLTRVNLWRK